MAISQSETNIEQSTLSVFFSRLRSLSIKEFYFSICIFACSICIHILLVCSALYKCYITQRLTRQLESTLTGAWREVIKIFKTYKEYHLSTCAYEPENLKKYVHPVTLEKRGQKWG